MKIKELFFSRSNEDIEKIIDYVNKQFSEHYNGDKERIKNEYLIFINECKKCEGTQPVNHELDDFLIVCEVFKDDLPEKIKYLDEEQTKIDFDYLEDYKTVHGIHLHELLEKQFLLGKTREEKKNEKVMPHTTYGIDFMERADVLECEILQLCLDKFDINELAGEFFWEMTWYGLLNETVDDKKEELIESFDEAMENIKNDEFIFENAKEVDLSDFARPDEKVLHNSDLINEYNMVRSDNFYKEYIEKYSDTQIKEIMNVYNKNLENER